MPTIYLLVVKQPPTKEKGCIDCQFEYELDCTIGRYIGSSAYDGKVPEWCPLQRVEVPE